MRKLRIGLAGLMQRNFSGDKESQYARSRAELGALQDELGFELFAVREGVYTEEDAWQAKRELESAGIDFLLIQSSSFASGALVTVLARTNAFLGLWAVPEPAASGPLPLNSFCGMNMNGSIIGTYLTGWKTPVKWFYGQVADGLFRDRFRLTVRALRAVVSLRESKIALVGGIANGFNNLYFDERRLVARFGIRLYRHEFAEIKDRVLASKPEDLQDITEAFAADAWAIAPPAQAAMPRNAAVFKAFADLARENGYAGLAVSCWPKFRLELGMVICAAAGRLGEEGLPVACEGDVYGLVSMLALRHLAGAPAMLLDLVDLDEADQTVQLWHCGVGCKSLAYRGQVKFNTHFNPTLIPGKGPVPAAPVAEMVLAPRQATVARFTGDGDSFFLFTGAFDRPEKGGFDGSRGWLGLLRMEGRPISVRDLVNSIMIHNVPHHYALVLDNVADPLREMAGWLGLRAQQREAYRDYLQGGEDDGALSPL